MISPFFVLFFTLPLRLIQTLNLSNHNDNYYCYENNNHFTKQNPLAEKNSGFYLK